jgi:hypothetical protein
MHRATPLNTSFRAYNAGGAKTVVESVDDSKLMQEMKGNAMRNQSHDNVESPQNYGFTSAVMDGDKENGKLTQGAETYLSYIGGNPSLPMAGAMDDRRHRLKGLEKGDSAMYRTKDDRQQFHFTKEGNFMSARSDRKQRIALVPPPQDDQQQQQSGRSATGQSGQSAQKSKKPTGQTSALDDNKNSTVYYDQSGTESVNRHSDAYSSQRPGDSTTYIQERKFSTQVTKDHAHLRTEDNRIFTDEIGCWSETPMAVKKDRYCKE